MNIEIGKECVFQRTPKPGENGVRLQIGKIVDFTKDIVIVEWTETHKNSQKYKIINRSDVIIIPVGPSLSRKLFESCLLVPCGLVLMIISIIFFTAALTG